VESIQYIAKTALARQTRKVIQAVQRGQTVVIEHHGQPEAAIMDIMDYHLLRAVLHFHMYSPQVDADAGLSHEAVTAQKSLQKQVNLIMAYYLSEAISLGRTAELLNLPWLDLRTRCLRLDIPLRTSPATLDELNSDVENAAAFTTISS
jgi:antitoxin (DNA-binding transcriptional repressor) of toxin-antitoxin stability system/predicted HTH domain antitoxin